MKTNALRLKRKLNIKKEESNTLNDEMPYFNESLNKMDNNLKKKFKKNKKKKKMHQILQEIELYQY